MVHYSNIQLTDPNPITEPVTLAALKAWLQVDYTDLDSLITGMGRGARESVELFTNLSLIPKTVALDVTLSKSEDVVLPFCREADPETVTLTRINADGSDGDELTIATDYNLRGATLKGLAAGEYHIEYTATPTVTEALKEAIKMEVAERFENRGENVKEYASSVNGLSQPAKEKAAPYRQAWL